MEELESGKDKIKKICDILKNETIDPAKEQALKILSEAEQQAKEIVHQAEIKAEEIYNENQKRIEKEKVLFQSSIEQACKQGMETLKQDITNKLFNTTIVEEIEKQTKDTNLIAKLITVMISAIEKEGTSADFSVYVAKNIQPQDLNTLLGKEFLSKLKEKSVVVADFIGGIELKLHDKQLTLDLSDKALKELLARFLHKNFRQFLFKAVPEE